MVCGQHILKSLLFIEWLYLNTQKLKNNSCCNHEICLEQLLNLSVELPLSAGDCCSQNVLGRALKIATWQKSLCMQCVFKVVQFSLEKQRYFQDTLRPRPSATDTHLALMEVRVKFLKITGFLLFGLTNPSAQKPSVSLEACSVMPDSLASRQIYK